MTTPHTIIVGMDHTPSSTAALRWAAEEARRTGAQVRAIHVWQCSESAKHQHLPDVEREEVHDNATRWIVDALAGSGPDVDVSLEILDGDPATTLVTAAADATLLVLGANTFTPGGLPASDLLEYCVVNSPCRVVVINGHDRRIPSPRTYAEAS